MSVLKFNRQENCILPLGPLEWRKLFPNRKELEKVYNIHSIPIFFDNNLSFLVLVVIKEISQFEVRSDDIWIITYPKCGTTWMQELAWLIASRGTASNYVFDLVIYVSALFVELFNRHVWLRLEENK